MEQKHQLFSSIWAVLILPAMRTGLLPACVTEKATAPPPEFASLAEVTLSIQRAEGEIIDRFTVEAPAEVAIFYALPNIDIGSIDLILAGPVADRRIIMAAEDYRTDQNGSGQWPAVLEPDQYSLYLANGPGRGFLAVYWRLP